MSPPEANRSPPPLVILVHVPKTGGTSLRVAAERYYGRRRMLFDYGIQARLTSRPVREFVYRNPDLARFRDLALGERYRFLSGHFHADKYLDLFPEAVFVTWIREPAERVWSAYRHYRTHHGFEGSFEDFYSQPRFQNQQSRFLGKNVDRIDFIGITERFGSSLNHLNQLLGTDFEQHRANRTARSELAGPSEPDRARILKLNARDLALYRRVERRFPGTH